MTRYEATEDSYDAWVVFDDMSDVVFEEKLTVKEMLPGFFEFNQYFFNKGVDTSDLNV